MFATPTEIIYSSMRLCGVIAKNETPDSGEMQDAMQALNLMLEQWSARRLIIRATIQYSHVLVANQASYVIGSGAPLFNTPKPITVTSAFIRDSNNVDEPVDVISREEYDSYGDKAITAARPVAICYDPGAAQQVNQQGTILVYPMPDASTTYTLFMQMQNSLNDFTTLTDTVTFEAKYGEAMKYELAKRLWREYHESHEPIPGDILNFAERAMCVLEKTNHVLPRAAMEIPPRKSVFNIYTGDYS